MKKFQSAASSASGLPNAVDIEFAFDDLEFVAHAPTSAQFALLLAGTEGGSSASMVRSVLEFFEGILDDEDYETLRHHLATGGGSLETLVEIMEWLIAEWSERPTTQRVASSPSRKSTGKRSTAKPRSTAATR